MKIYLFSDKIENAVKQIKIYSHHTDSMCVITFKDFFIDLKTYYKQKSKCNVRMSQVLK